MFYQRLSEYYDEVFPLHEQTRAFLKKHLSGMNCADAACGTGTVALALAELGFSCTAADMEPAMIRQARSKDGGGTVEFLVDDMRNIRRWGTFDAVICLGNSLSHLPSLEEVAGFVREVYAALVLGGTAVFQIVNYDRVMAAGVDGLQLPTLGNEKVQLQRRYVPEGRNSVRFHSKLVVSNRSFDEVITLQPILHGELRAMLEQAGFSVEFFGSYAEAAYDPDTSASLIAKASAG